MHPAFFENQRVGRRYAGASLVLDFATPYFRDTVSGPSYNDPARLAGWTFTRTQTAANTATAEDDARNYWSFPANTPRRTNKGLLVEEARTNLTLSSLDYAGANWSKTSAAVGALVAGPDGALSASPITGSGSGELVRDAAAITVASGSTYAVSKIVKRGNFDWLRLFAVDTTATTNGVNAWFNLATGAVGTIAAIGAGWTAGAASVQALGGGFYRLTLVVTTGATTLYTRLQSAPSDGGTTRADVGSGAGVGTTYTLHNSDVTLGAFALSPILTAGAAGTRGADSAKVQVDPIPASGPFAIYVDAVWPANVLGIQYGVSLNDGTTNNRIGINRDATGQIVLRSAVGGVDQLLQGKAGFGGSARLKAAILYDGTNYRSVFPDGTTSTVVAGSVPVTTQVEIGTQIGVSPVNGFVRAVVVHARDVSLAEAQNWVLSGA